MIRASLAWRQAVSMSPRWIAEDASSASNRGRILVMVGSRDAMASVRIAWAGSARPSHGDAPFSQQTSVVKEADAGSALDGVVTAGVLEDGLGAIQRGERGAFV